MATGFSLHAVEDDNPNHARTTYSGGIETRLKPGDYQVDIDGKGTAEVSLEKWSRPGGDRAVRVARETRRPEAHRGHRGRPAGVRSRGSTSFSPTRAITYSKALDSHPSMPATLTLYGGDGTENEGMTHPGIDWVGYLPSGPISRSRRPIPRTR